MHATAEALFGEAFLESFPFASFIDDFLHFEAEFEIRSSTFCLVWHN
jgi:hypothetical protein